MRIVLCLGVLLLLSVFAQAAPLRVGVAGAAPFAMIDRLGKPAGFCVDVWVTAAGQEAMPYELIQMPSRTEAIRQVVSGELDVAVGDIAMTADRAAEIDFTVPFCNTSLGLLSRTDEPGILKRFQRMVTGEILVVVAIFLFILFSIGNLLWLAERRSNKEFPSGYKDGVLEGVWLALVTITSVGYGDRVPRTTRGRILLGSCMIVATLGISSLTATIASTLTVSMNAPGLNSEHDLAGRRVAVVAGTPAVTFVRRFGGRPILFNKVEDVISAVVYDQADAAVAEYPEIGYNLSQNPHLPVVLYKSTGLMQDYGFAFARGNPLVTRFNVTILRMKESGRITQIEDAWLSASLNRS